MSKISDYQKGYINFYDFFCKTGKYKELWRDHSSFFSIILATMFTPILYHYIIIDKNYLHEIIEPLLLSFSAGLFSLLGVYIAGLAIFMSIIKPNTIENLNRKNGIHNLVGILFSFYFIGAFVLLTILLFIIGYLSLPIDFALQYILNEDIYNFIIPNGVVIYLWITLFSFFFSISYTVALLGTCINFFFANLYMEKINEQIQSEDRSAHDTYIVRIKKKQNTAAR